MSENEIFTTEYQYQVLKLFFCNYKFSVEFGGLLKEEYFEARTLSIIFNLGKRFVYRYEREIQEQDLIVEMEEYILSKGLMDSVRTMLKNEIKAIYKIHIQSEQFISDKLIKFVRRQEFKKALLTGADILEKDGSYESVLMLVDKAVSIGYGNDDGMNFTDLKDLPHLYKQVYNVDKLFKTGIHQYDRALGGGMAPKEVHVICAPPKSGKTTFGANVGAYGVASGKCVFHVTLEISVLDLLSKYATKLSNLTYEEVVDSVEGSAYHARIDRFTKCDPKLFVNYWTESSINTLTIRAWIAKIRSKFNVNPDLIIIDYDDLLLPTTGRQDDMYNEAGQIYTDLKSLADFFNCPLLTFAQPQRQAWHKPNNNELITAGDLAHSARKAHKAWSISTINFADDKENGILYMDMVRRGRSHTKVKLIRDLSRGQFKEPEEN